MKKAFITGPTGNIGSHLVQYLTDHNVDFTAGSRSIESQHYPTTTIDFENTNSLIKAFEGHELLFLLAPDSEQSHQWIENALVAAKKVGIKYVVRSSGIGANPNSKYFVFNELGKIEEQVKDSGINYTIVQPNSFFQNFATFQNQTVKNGSVFLPHEQATISYVDARDVALAIAHIIKDPSKHVNKSYVITGPKAISNQELLNEIGSAIGKEVNYVPVSDGDTASTFRQYHMPEHNIKQLISLYQADRAGETNFVSDDFENITGQKPRDAFNFASDYRQYWLD
ncbi:MAG: NmrA family NAD(P)-binding protein [Cyclobacteriaceae bacterium]|nr:NmrA family NAD(P)-binding protein [Cyclobacteriaceae bacterium SS2]MBV6647608.1 NmrA family NAD(P)-binding protein [Cyclobacteriaceae bacterium HetDA_MAG_MS6]